MKRRRRDTWLEGFNENQAAGCAGLLPIGTTPARNNGYLSINRVEVPHRFVPHGTAMAISTRCVLGQPYDRGYGGFPR